MMITTRSHDIRFTIRWLATLALSAVSAGCFGSRNESPTISGNPAADERAEQRVDESGDAVGATLYSRMGGAEAIQALVDDMTERVIADPRVNFDRSDVETSWLGTEYDVWEATPDNVAEFKKHMVDFLTLAAGGPAEYTGGDMQEVHEGMRITNNEFDAMVGDIKASMDKLGFGPREQRDLLAIVETTRKQIVEEH